MDIKEILAQLSEMNYACLFVMASGQRTKFGPGEMAWRRGLRSATAEQREALAAKLAHWSERRSA